MDRLGLPQVQHWYICCIVLRAMTYMHITRFLDRVFPTSRFFNFMHILQFFFFFSFCKIMQGEVLQYNRNIHHILVLQKGRNMIL